MQKSDNYRHNRRKINCKKIGIYEERFTIVNKKENFTGSVITKMPSVK